jgi:CMP-N-acetylneuraminic acid synthetase
MTDISSPLVTVYIANYNYEKYLEQAIESVLSQSMQDFELLVIDDGSTDNSQEVIHRYEAHPRIRTIFQENLGLTRTNNVAITASRGRYIMRLDADDYLDPQALLVMSNVLEQNPHVGLVFPDYYIVDKDGTILGQERRFDFSRDVTLLDLPAHGACTLIRKAFLIGIGKYTEDFSCQDGYDLWLRFSEQHEVRNVNLPLFYYRRHGSNLTENSHRILTTRAQIKRRHARNKTPGTVRALSVIPVRGPSVDPASPVLLSLGEDAVLLDWTVQAALGAQELDVVVVSTPDQDVAEYVRKRYGAEDRIRLHLRSVEFAREGVGLYDTVEAVRKECVPEYGENAYMILSPETPFRAPYQIDEAVHTLAIFELDSVIPIVPETDLFFRHTGAGLEQVGNDLHTRSLRLEREYIYRKLPGMSLVDGAYFHKTQTVVGTRLGHVTLDPVSAVTVRDGLDLEYARLVLAHHGDRIRSGFGTAAGTGKRTGLDAR